MAKKPVLRPVPEQDRAPAKQAGIGNAMPDAGRAAQRDGIERQIAAAQPVDREILSLLAQVSARLHKNEADRKALIETLSSYRDSIGDIEARTEQSEKIFLTLQDRLAKQESAEDTLRRRQDLLELQQKAQAERIARSAALTDRIESALEQQAQLHHRLEQLMPPEGAAQSRPFAGFLPAGLAGTDDMNGWSTRRVLRSAGLTLAVFLAIAGGFAISQSGGGLSRAPVVGSTSDNADLAAAGAQSVARSDTENVAESTQTTNGAAIPLLEQRPVALPNDADPQSVLTMTDEERMRQFDQDPDALAAALNAIEPTERAPETSLAEATTTDTGPIADSTTAPTEADATAQAAAPIPTAGAENAAKGTGTNLAAAAAPVRITSLPVRDPSFDVSEFIRSQTPSGTLSSRIQRDASLPPLVKDIESRAFAGSAESQHDLGAIYTAGHGGVRIDYISAAAWFREAAISGIANARYNLGVLYHQGLGVTRNLSLAMGWYRSAAALGHPEAQYNLGIAHVKDAGATYDPALAARYFRRAAQGGVMEAAFNLGLVYENGLLGKDKMDEALYWYDQGADMGSPEARAALTTLSRGLKFSPTQLQDAIARGATAEKSARASQANAGEENAGSLEPEDRIAAASAGQNRADGN